MDYIIDPMWIYWANVITNVRETTGILFFISLAAFGLSCVLYWSKVDAGPAPNEHFCKKCKTVIIVSIITSIICIIFKLFIPTKETIIEMVVAKLTTKSNIKIGIEEVKQLIEFTANAFKPIE